MREKIEIVIDSNERSHNNWYVNYLEKICHEKDHNPCFYRLNAGDLKIGTILIEMKTPSDLLGRKDGALRIRKQIEKLKDAEKQGYTPIIIIHGTFSSLARRYKDKFHSRILPQFYGLVSSIMLKDHIPIYHFTSNNHLKVWLRNTFLREIARRGFNAYPLRATPQRFSLKDEIKYLLQGVKGVGAAKSSKMIKEGGCNSLFEILSEIACPIDTDIISVDQVNNIYSKWIRLLNEKTFKHFQELLIKPLEVEKDD